MNLLQFVDAGILSNPWVNARTFFVFLQARNPRCEKAARLFEKSTDTSKAAPCGLGVRVNGIFVNNVYVFGLTKNGEGGYLDRMQWLAGILKKPEKVPVQQESLVSLQSMLFVRKEVAHACH